MSKALVKKLLNQHRDGFGTKEKIYAIVVGMIENGEITEPQGKAIKKQVRTALRKKRPAKCKSAEGNEIITARCYLCNGYFDNLDVDLVVIAGNSQHACKGCLKEADELNLRPIPVEQLRENVSWPDRHELRRVMKKG